MNSSISISEFRPGGDRTKALLFLAVFSFSLAVILFFNRWIDPYNVFGGGEWAAQQLHGRANLVMEAMVELNQVSRAMKQQAAIVIIGDSRARALTQQRAEGAPGESVLNLGIGGASFEEAVTMLADEVPELHSTQLLIAALPFERFSAAARANRCEEVRDLVDHPFHYLANAEILSHSWELWRNSLAGRGAAASRWRSAAQNAEEDASVVVTWKRMFVDYDPVRTEERVRLLEKTIQPLISRGAKVVFWWPPVRVSILQTTLELHQMPERDALRARLARIGGVVDMTEWTALHQTPFVFSDPVHTLQGLDIFRELKAMSSRTPQVPPRTE